MRIFWNIQENRVIKLFMMSAVSVLSHGYNVIRGVLRRNKYSDLVLKTSTGEAVNCHKVVMTAVSEKVKSMLHKNDCSELVIRNVSHGGLNKLIEFIYEGRVDIASSDLLIDFADAYTVLRCDLGKSVANMIKNISDSNEEIGSSQPMQGEVFKCETCNKTFKNKKKLHRHMK